MDPILKLCGTHNEGLYVLPDKPKKPPNQQVFVFRKSWGRHQQVEVKGYVLARKEKLWTTDERKVIDNGSKYEHFASGGSGSAAII